MAGEWEVRSNRKSRRAGESWSEASRRFNATVREYWVYCSAHMKNEGERERQQLQQRYARMNDGELLRIAGDFKDLTDVARELITDELGKRGLKPGGEIPEPDIAEEQLPVHRAAGFLHRWLEKHFPSNEDPDTSRYGAFATHVAPGATVPKGDEDAFVTATRFLELPRALVVRGALTSAEISCVLCDSEMVRMNWLYTNLIGWMRLQVPPQDWLEAVAIIDEPIPERFEVPGIGEYEQPRCPRCKSLDINFHENTWVAYASLYVNLPIPIVRNGWRCSDCRLQWRGADENAA